MVSLLCGEGYAQEVLSQRNHCLLEMLTIPSCFTFTEQKTLRMRLLHAVLQKADERRDVNEILDQQVAYYWWQKVCDWSSAHTVLHLVIISHHNHQAMVDEDIIWSLSVAPLNPY